MAQVSTSLVSSSGVKSFAPPLSDLTLEAFARCQIRPSQITQSMMTDARFSANYMLSDWSNEVPNLWLIDQQTIPLIQGVNNYSVPASTITVLDVYIRTFSLSTSANLGSNPFTTTNNSTTVSVYQPAHGQVPGNWVQFPVYASVNGIVLYGPYQVVTVTDANDYTITAASAATSGGTGGTVPLFTPSSGSATITVTLANHGFVPNSTFTVYSATAVGGLTISGAYTVVSVPNTSTFTITAPGLANSNTGVYENNGAVIVQTQPANVQPIDRYLYGISRTEWAATPNKTMQSPPTTYWYDRLDQPSFNIWPAPDGNGPYTLLFYRVFQPDDAVMPGGVGIQMPYRFYDAFAAGLAARLGEKYLEAPQAIMALAQKAEMTFRKAANQDVERVPMFISPGLNSYFDR